MLAERFHDFGLAIIKIGGEPDALESIIREFHRIELSEVAFLVKWIDRGL